MRPRATGLRAGIIPLKMAVERRSGNHPETLINTGCSAVLGDSRERRALNPHCETPTNPPLSPILAECQKKKPDRL